MTRRRIFFDRSVEKGVSREIEPSSRTREIMITYPVKKDETKYSTNELIRTADQTTKFRN